MVPLYRNTPASDFASTYYPAAHRFATGGDPYTIRFYVQPLALLFLLAPFTILPLEEARAVWLVLEIGMVLVGIAAWLRACAVRVTPGLLLLISLVISSPNIVWGVVIGQSVVLMALLEGLGLWLLRRNQPFWGGIALGALVLKPHMLAVILPALVIASRRAWLGAATSIGLLLLGPELLGVHLLLPFLRKLLPQAGLELYNKLNPADLFVNLGSGGFLRVLGWGVLAGGAIIYGALLWRIWRTRPAAAEPWQATPLVLAAMAAAFLWLPYSLAYDLILVMGLYLWRFAADGYQMSRLLLWNLAALWLLPILTLLLHAWGVPTTLNPLLIIGLLLLMFRQPKLGNRSQPNNAPLAESNDPYSPPAFDRLGLTLP